MYITTFQGTTNNGILGPVSIVRRQPSSDVQANWDRVGGAASNAASVKKESINYNAVNTQYVETTESNDTDIYAMSDSNGSALDGRKVRAMYVQAYLARGGSTIPEVRVGVKSGTATTEGPTTQIPSNTPALLTQIFELDSNGNKEWTIDAARAAPGS